MQLTEIKLSGFKSFVDPTTIKFPSNIMGVVGPNGCGKSNVIDAVRWVMGESSAKQLRGESMTDVIFSGSSARKPVATATVELVFDNADGRAGGEYAKYSEISVKRQVSRDGTSNYFLNGTRCRRKDITDLFLGTGLGPRSYAIIEQGMISQIVEARPEELRAFLEEAAGISRYKERRRETENRIKHTRENLERLTDLRDEVSKQLEKLKRQAKSAERYRELKDRYRVDEAKLQALRWRELKGQMDQQAARIAKLQTELEARMAEQRAAEKELEKLRQAQHSASEESSKVQARLYEVGAEIARLEQAIEHQREIRRRQETEHAKIENQMSELQQHLVLDKAQVSETTSLVAKLEPNLTSAQATEQSAVALMDETEQALSTWQSQWDELQVNRSAVDAQVKLIQQNLAHLDGQMRRDAERKSVLDGQTGDELSGQLIAEAQTLGAEAQAQAQGIEQLESAINQTNECAENLAGQIEQTRDNLEQARAQKGRWESRIESLEVLNRSQGPSEEALAWLRESADQNPLALMEQVAVSDPAMTPAVEQVLAGWLDAYVASHLSIEKALQQRHWNLSLVTASGDQPKVGTLATCVSNAGALVSVLNQVWVAEDIGSAQALLKTLPQGESVILADGTWLGHGWVKQPISDTERNAGILVRQEEMRDLQPKIAEVAKQIEALENGLARLRSDLETNQSVLQKQQTEKQALERQLSDTRGRLIGIETRLKSIDSQKEAQAKELEEIVQRMADNTQEVKAARESLEANIERLSQHQEQQARFEEEKRQLLSRRQANGQALTEARTEREAIALQLQSANSGLQSLSQSIERMDHQVGQLQVRYVELSQALAQGDEPVKQLESQRDHLLKQRLEVEVEMKAARGQLEELEALRRQADEARQGAMAAVDQLREQINQANLTHRESEIKSENLLTRIKELKADLEELLDALPEDAETAALQEELEKLEEQIRRLEPVNLAAIDELAVETERKEYLDKQNADLEEALETLEKAIERIDKESRTRFKETFDQINTNIGILFPRLFGGGHAHLEMVGNDWLSAGISIMARPPGKRVSRIHLMSGGEKALTAVSFVFAIFNLNPAPFCLLDEVDAPLDDANVGRFTEMVKEMSNTVQFIVVTHNKVTMEAAHQMLGVTMREPGVSRLVSVDLDKAVELAEA